MYRSGLIGRAIQASRSPRLHEGEARAQGLALEYELFDFDQRGYADSELETVLRRLSREDYCGVNVTFPFKQMVIPLLDGLADDAAAVGAVNTIAMRDGRLIGHNTDKSGFEGSFREGLPGASTTHVLQLGAGGAGAAVANALLSLGTGMLEIVDRDDAKARALVDRLASLHGKDRLVIGDAARLDTAQIDGIVNTTPMGMAANPAPAIDAALIAAHHWVADIVYFPLETELLRLAKARGCRVLNGSGMVIGQAALAFGIFTGHVADKARMRRIFEGLL